MTTVKLKGRRRGAEPSINTCQGNKKENISTFYLEHFNGAILLFFQQMTPISYSIIGKYSTILLYIKPQFQS